MENESNAHRAICALIEGAEKIIRIRRDFLELFTACILAKGHVLLEDNPGCGKTSVAKTFAALLGDESSVRFKRIQFTPDLLPYDITGVDVFDPESRSFRFVPGPVLSNVVLADEINRTSPKVQSALLEVMAERQVTIGNSSHKTPKPFFVIATQNPIESEGTFPLPAAQLDRFMIKLSLGYPERDAEISILNDNPAENALLKLKPVISVDAFLALQDAVDHIFCHPLLKEAIVDIVRETRTERTFVLGASPRAALHLLSLSQALALVRGRSYVIDEDIVNLAGPALAHRLKIRDAKSDVSKMIRELALEKIGRIKNLS
jgi:MoxR-like ATPase